VLHDFTSMSPTHYHRHCVASRAFHRVDFEIWRKPWRWSRRRHPNKGARWVRSRYFHTMGGRTWTFAALNSTRTSPGQPILKRLVYACMSPSIPRQDRWKLFAHTPPSAAAFPVKRAGRLLRYVYRGLFDVHSHCNLHAHRIANTTLCTEGSSGFVTSTAASVVTG
jgi:hypothetical protein